MVSLSLESLLAEKTVADLQSRTKAPRKPATDVLIRTVDVVLAATLLVLLSPVMTLAAALVKLEDRGPVFFTQLRTGRHGETIRLVKFRSMVVNAEAKGAGLRLEKNDPRITRTGRFLRRTHLDEIPQLVDVLTGRLALVGPRPALTFQKDHYESWEMRRLAVRPGVTGLAQALTGNESDWDQRLKLDVYWVDYRSLRLWCYVIALTAVRTMSGRGVYSERGHVKGWNRDVPIELETSKDLERREQASDG